MSEVRGMSAQDRRLRWLLGHRRTLSQVGFCTPVIFEDTLTILSWLCNESIRRADVQGLPVPYAGNARDRHVSVSTCSIFLNHPLASKRRIRMAPEPGRIHYLPSQPLEPPCFHTADRQSRSCTISIPARSHTYPSCTNGKMFTSTPLADPPLKGRRRIYWVVVRSNA